MNERIKELAEQAGFNPYNYEGANAALFKKFAELIVRECSQYIEDKFDFCGDEIIIAEKLREHFGVEEDQEDTDSACQLCGEDGGTTCGMPGCQY